MKIYHYKGTIIIDVLFIFVIKKNEAKNSFQYRILITFNYKIENITRIIKKNTI
jgi:hypothetical protein